MMQLVSASVGGKASFNSAMAQISLHNGYPNKVSTNASLI